MALSFPTDLTIDSCEEFMSKLDGGNPEEPLYLPMESNNSHFGGIAAAIQAVNTWGRLRRNRQLVVGGKSQSSEEQVRDSVSKPHRLCASMWGQIISDSAGSIDLRPQINEAASKVVAEQGKSKFGQQRGPLCWFSFVDHSTKGFDKNFYIHPKNEKPQPRQMAQIETVICSMVERSIDVMGGAKRLSQDSTAHLGRMFFELFMNSHEHGSRSAPRTEWIKPGQRVIYTNGINLSKSAMDKRTHDERGLSLYLKSFEGLADRGRFIEISIVDSGYGYYKRWCTDKSESFNDGDVGHEYLILKKCFTARQTSTESSSKGHGLPVVMDRLTKLKGFIRVRSGRLSLYRDFVAQPYVSDDPCEFFDWVTESPAQTQITSMQPVAGASVTLLIPLEAKQ
ncbi:hypothetical protein [Pseudomonas multiresinivorans]|uniref:Uncharacterized protein n=1 Tax=Pseudomonas multiresinivorans TaxID=95301 RepID=A0A7Z3BNK9_9PSED|nr:hypothetical protein [Pseudomonas multiresinivorans]QJP09974.1 hypothetical protein G4G71_19535 [Pseudomonas multiresinivorans]